MDKVSLKPHCPLNPQDISNDELLELALNNLPHPPTAVLRLLKELRSENSNFDVIKREMKYDPGFITLILQMAADYSRQKNREPVDSLERAIQVLGYERMRMFAMSVCTFELLDRHGRSVSLDMEYFWGHSFATAVAARGLAQLSRVGRLDEEECYLGGIIADIGTLYMGMLFGEQYAKLHREHSGELEEEQICLKEWQELEVDHCDFGYRLGEHFGFPRYMLQAIKHHHDYYKMDRLDIFEKVIVLANRIGSLIMKVSNGVSAKELHSLRRILGTELKIPERSVAVFLRQVIREVPNQVKFYRLGDIDFQQNLLLEVLKMKERLSQQMDQSPECRSYLEKMEQYLPCSIAAAYCSIDANLEVAARIDAVNTTVENYMQLLGVLHICLLEHNGLKETEVYKKYQAAAGGYATIGNWIGLINRSLSFFDQNPEYYYPTGLLQLKELKAAGRRFSAVRNEYTHGKSIPTARERSMVFKKEHHLVWEILSGSSFFYNCFFFHVEKTELDRSNGYLYWIKKWVSSLPESNRKIEKLSSTKRMHRGVELYFYDGESNTVINCFPYLRRMEGEQNNQVLIYQKQCRDGKFEYEGLRDRRKYRLFPEITEEDLDRYDS